MQRRSVPLDRLEGLWASERGLLSGEVVARTQSYGTNDIIEAPPHPWRGLVVDTAKDPMLWFFAGTSVLYWAVGQRIEALTLLVAILPLLGMDVYLHRRTQASTEGLKSRLSTTATALRDGVKSTLPSSQLVPGDLVFVTSGDAIPADGLLVKSSNMQVDESVLTGEAYPVIKRQIAGPPTDGGEPLVDEVHWAFAGTRILTGDACIRLVFTGQETIYGEIVRSAVHGSHESTPLQLAIRYLVKILLVAALVACGILAAVRLHQGNDWLDALISAATLAATAIPEEFPVVFTFLLGVGVYRLAKRQALVRRAVVVENIGRVSVICSDKTGTLTEGRLHLAHLLPTDGLSEAQLQLLATIAARAESGDPMDNAILRWPGQSTKTGDAQNRHTTFPFTEDRKRETGVVSNTSGRLLAVTKGAIEVISSICEISDAERDAWLARAAELADQAHKVVAVAQREMPQGLEVNAEPDSGFSFAGLLAFEDPVRPGVREAVQACRSAGIHVIMVTGDHPLTARAVAREVGLGGAHPRVLLGDELELGKEKRQLPTLREVDVIARAKPAQKLLLVKYLQESGEIVAVTGDGVNDVPALQSADIGIAMGERGTRSAREVAAIILLDDNFRTIVGAIGEGRQLFENLQLSFNYLLVIHIPLVLTATLIPLAGYPLLYLPIHVVWLEMLIHPTAMLVFQDLPARELLPRGATAKRGRFFDAKQWGGIIVTGIFIAAVVTVGYLRSLEGRINVEHGRAMALASLILASVAVTAVLSRLRTPTAQLVCLCTLVTTVLLIQTPMVGHWLHLQPLHLDDWALVALFALIAGALLLGTARWRASSSASRMRPVPDSIDPS
jgi:P-type Ca2+ transporter type 2C